MRNQHKLILSNDELLNSKLRDEFISNLKKEGFLSRKIFFYKKGIKEEINIENHISTLEQNNELNNVKIKELENMIKLYEEKDKNSQVYSK